MSVHVLRAELAQPKPVDPFNFLRRVELILDALEVREQSVARGAHAIVAGVAHQFERELDKYAALDSGEVRRLLEQLVDCVAAVAANLPPPALTTEALARLRRDARILEALRHIIGELEETPAGGVARAALELAESRVPVS